MNPHKDLQAALEAIQQKWGVKALHLAHQMENRSYLSTGFPALDQLLGGGFPRGRLIELFGQPTSGVTTLALRVMAVVQQQQEIVVYLDLPQTFDPEYAAVCQVQVNELLLVRPQQGMDATGILFDVVTSGIPGIVVVNALTPLPPAERKPLLAALERIQAALARSRCVLLVLTSPQTPLTSPSAALRLRVERESWMEAGEEVRGYQVKVTVLKHKAAAEGQNVHLFIRLDGGEET